MDNLPNPEASEVARQERVAELGDKLRKAELVKDRITILEKESPTQKQDLAEAWTEMDKIKQERYKTMSDPERLVVLGDALSDLNELSRIKPESSKIRISTERLLNNAFGSNPDNLSADLKQAIEFIKKNNAWLDDSTKNQSA